MINWICLVALVWQQNKGTWWSRYISLHNSPHFARANTRFAEFSRLWTDEKFLRSLVGVCAHVCKPAELLSRASVSR